MSNMYYVLIANQVIILTAVFFGVRLLFRIVNSSTVWRDAIPQLTLLLERIDRMTTDTQQDLLTDSEYKRLNHDQDEIHENRESRH